MSDEANMEQIPTEDLVKELKRRGKTVTIFSLEDIRGVIESDEQYSDLSTYTDEACQDILDEMASDLESYLAEKGNEFISTNFDQVLEAVEYRDRMLEEMRFSQR